MKPNETNTMKRLHLVPGPVVKQDTQDGNQTRRAMRQHTHTHKHRQTDTLSHQHKANEGKEGIEVAAEFRPNVILMDLGMPKMNGLDAARHIRKQPWGKNTLLVALTGWGQDDDRRKTKDAGFDHRVAQCSGETGKVRAILKRGAVFKAEMGHSAGRLTLLTC
mgnify:CR=1 FL=1